MGSQWPTGAAVWWISWVFFIRSFFRRRIFTWSKAGPGCRGRWLNRQISQIDPAYCHTLVNYNHILRQRNACLKAWERMPDEDTLAVWNDQLVEYGSQISLRRQQIIAALNQIAAPLHDDLATGEGLELRYQCNITGRESFSSAAGLVELYRRELQRHSHAERLRGATLVGPHRDDINILINGDAARDFASQGQQRTLALSLKLSELELAYAEKGEYPVLLLDDALSELDDQRGRRILELPAKTQTFISAATRRPRSTRALNGWSKPSTAWHICSD